MSIQTIFEDQQTDYFCYRFNIMSVKVAIRVRPFNERENFLGCICCVDMRDNTTILYENREKNKKQHYFTFDYSIWSHDEFHIGENGYMHPTSNRYIDQQKVYNLIGKEILENAWQGYNCCLFAYGQTGAGKSYSMIGYGVNRGLIPMVCEELFNKIKKFQKKGEKQYQISLSMLEIYNEKVQDLFVSTNKRPPNGLKVRQNKTLGVYVQGLTKLEVLSYNDIERRMDQGSKNRSLASTLMNQYSSRAHTIVMIQFVQKEWINKLKMNKKSSFLNLVDLAGSERVAKTGISDNKDRLKEASNINKSLHTLGRVIETLAEQAAGKAKNSQVPYRDSSLTRILQSALGGNSKTIMICAISPANDNYQQTLSTLRYADQTKKIKNKPIVNESAVDKIIRQLREENERLKKMLETNQQSSPQKSLMTQVEKKQIRSNLRASMRQVQKQIKKNLKSFAINTQQVDQQEDSLMMTEFIDLEDPSQFFSELSFDLGNKAQVYITNLNEDELLNYKVRYSCEKDILVTNKNNKKSIKGMEEFAKIVLCGLGIQQNHAKIISNITKDKFYIQALSETSAEYTLLNGKPVIERRQLEHNDRIILGINTVFIFKNNLKKIFEKQTKIDYEFVMNERQQQMENLSLIPPSSMGLFLSNGLMRGSPTRDIYGAPPIQAYNNTKKLFQQQSEKEIMDKLGQIQKQFSKLVKENEQKIKEKQQFYRTKLNQIKQEKQKQKVQKTSLQEKLMIKSIQSQTLKSKNSQLEKLKKKLQKYNDQKNKRKKLRQSMLLGNDEENGVIQEDIIGQFVDLEDPNIKRQMQIGTDARAYDKKKKMQKKGKDYNYPQITFQQCNDNQDVISKSIHNQSLLLGDDEPFKEKGDKTKQIIEQFTLQIKLIKQRNEQLEKQLAFYKQRQYDFQFRRLYNIKINCEIERQLFCLSCRQKLDNNPLNESSKTNDSFLSKKPPSTFQDAQIQQLNFKSKQNKRVITQQEVLFLQQQIIQLQAKLQSKQMKDFQAYNENDQLLLDRFSYDARKSFAPRKQSDSYNDIQLNLTQDYFPVQPKPQLKIQASSFIQILANIPKLSYFQQKPIEVKGQRLKTKKNQMCFQQSVHIAANRRQVAKRNLQIYHRQGVNYEPFQKKRKLNLQIMSTQTIQIQPWQQFKKRQPVLQYHQLRSYFYSPGSPLKNRDRSLSISEIRPVIILPFSQFSRRRPTLSYSTQKAISIDSLLPSRKKILNYSLLQPLLIIPSQQEKERYKQQKQQQQDEIENYLSQKKQQKILSQSKLQTIVVKPTIRKKAVLKVSSQQSITFEPTIKQKPQIYLNFSILQDLTIQPTPQKQIAKNLDIISYQGIQIDSTISKFNQQATFSIESSIDVQNKQNSLLKPMYDQIMPSLSFYDQQSVTYEPSSKRQVKIQVHSQQCIYIPPTPISHNLTYLNTESLAISPDKFARINKIKLQKYNQDIIAIEPDINFRKRQPKLVFQQLGNVQVSPTESIKPQLSLQQVTSVSFIPIIKEKSIKSLQSLPNIQINATKLDKNLQISKSEQVQYSSPNFSRQQKEQTSQEHSQQPDNIQNAGESNSRQIADKFNLSFSDIQKHELSYQQMSVMGFDGLMKEEELNHKINLLERKIKQLESQQDNKNNSKQQVDEQKFPTQEFMKDQIIENQQQPNIDAMLKSLGAQHIFQPSREAQNNTSKYIQVRKNKKKRKKKTQLTEQQKRQQQIQRQIQAKIIQCNNQNIINERNLQIHKRKRQAEELRKILIKKEKVELQKQLLVLIPMIRRFNLIARQMKRLIEAKIQIQYRNFSHYEMIQVLKNHSANRSRSNTNNSILIRIVVLNCEQGRVYTWFSDVFKNRFEIAQQIFQRYLQSNQDPLSIRGNLQDRNQRAKDPFWDPIDYVSQGIGYLSMQSLLYNISYDGYVSLIYKSVIIAKIYVSITPVKVKKRSNEQDEGEDQSQLDNIEIYNIRNLLQTDLYFTISIQSIKFIQNDDRQKLDDSSNQINLSSLNSNILKYNISYELLENDYKLVTFTTHEVDFTADKQFKRIDYMRRHSFQNISQATLAYISDCPIKFTLNVMKDYNDEVLNASFNQQYSQDNEQSELDKSASIDDKSSTRSRQNSTTELTVDPSLKRSGTTETKKSDFSKKPSVIYENTEIVSKLESEAKKQQQRRDKIKRLQQSQSKNGKGDKGEKDKQCEIY